MDYDSNTAQYLQNLTNIGGLYAMALAMKTGAWEIYLNQVNALYEAYTGGLVMTDAAFVGALAYGGLPVVTMVGVFMALGSGYLEARHAVEDENSRIGFAEGFVTGVLGWRGSQVKSLFGRQGTLRIYQTDEQLNVIRVNAYNEALVKGYSAALALPPAARKGYVSKLRSAAGHPSSGDWTRNDQISFVISLATAGLAKGVIGK